MYKYTDMANLIQMDPIREYDETGWPRRQATVTKRLKVTGTGAGLAAFFDEARQVFAQAAGAGAVLCDYALAGRAWRVHYANAALAATLHPALAHLAAPPAPNPFDLYAWGGELPGGSCPRRRGRRCPSSSAATCAVTWATTTASSMIGGPALLAPWTWSGRWACIGRVTQPPCQTLSAPRPFGGCCRPGDTPMGCLWRMPRRWASPMAARCWPAATAAASRPRPRCVSGRRWATRAMTTSWSSRGRSRGSTRCTTRPSSTAPVSTGCRTIGRR